MEQGVDGWNTGLLGKECHSHDHSGNLSTGCGTLRFQLIVGNTFNNALCIAPIDCIGIPGILFYIGEGSGFLEDRDSRDNQPYR